MNTPASTKVEQLLPCPFCGSPAEILHFNDGENEGGSCVACTRCQASSNVEFGFKENFVSNWNRRTTLTPAPSGEGREDIARLIDPNAWTKRQELLGSAEHWSRNPNGFAAEHAEIFRRGNLKGADEKIAPSLKLADAILALLAPHKDTIHD